MKKYIIKIISIILIISFSLNQISYAGGDFSHLRPAACRASIPLTEASFSGIHYAGLKGLEALLTDINRRRAEGGLPHDEDTIAKTKELRSMIQRMLSEDKPDTSLIWMKDRKDPPAELFTLTFESYDVRQIIKEDVSVNEATLKKYPQLRKKWPIYRELLKSYIFIISHLYPILVELQWKVGVNFPQLVHRKPERIFIDKDGLEEDVPQEITLLDIEEDILHELLDLEIHNKAILELALTIHKIYRYLSYPEARLNGLIGFLEDESNALDKHRFCCLLCWLNRNRDISPLDKEGFENILQFVDEALKEDEGLYARFLEGRSGLRDEDILEEVVHVLGIIEDVKDKGPLRNQIADGDFRDIGPMCKLSPLFIDILAKEIITILERDNGEILENALEIILIFEDPGFQEQLRSKDTFEKLYKIFLETEDDQMLLRVFYAMARLGLHIEFFLRVSDDLKATVGPTVVFRRIIKVAEEKGCTKERWYHFIKALSDSVFKAFLGDDVYYEFADTTLSKFSELKSPELALDLLAGFVIHKETGEIDEALIRGIEARLPDIEAELPIEEIIEQRVTDEEYPFRANLRLILCFLDLYRAQTKKHELNILEDIARIYISALSERKIMNAASLANIYYQMALVRIKLGEIAQLGEAVNDLRRALGTDRNFEPAKIALEELERTIRTLRGRKELGRSMIESGRRLMIELGRRLEPTPIEEIDVEAIAERVKGDFSDLHIKDKTLAKVRLKRLLEGGIWPEFPEELLDDEDLLDEILRRVIEKKRPGKTNQDGPPRRSPSWGPGSPSIDQPMDTAVDTIGTKKHGLTRVEKEGLDAQLTALRNHETTLKQVTDYVLSELPNERELTGHLIKWLKEANRNREEALARKIEKLIIRVNRRKGSPGKVEIISNLLHSWSTRDRSSAEKIIEALGDKIVCQLVSKGTGDSHDPVKEKCLGFLAGMLGEGPVIKTLVERSAATFAGKSGHLDFIAQAVGRAINAGNPLTTHLLRIKENPRHGEKNRKRAGELLEAVARRTNQAHSLGSSYIYTIPLLLIAAVVAAVAFFFPPVREWLISHAPLGAGLGLLFMGGIDKIDRGDKPDYVPFSDLSKIQDLSKLPDLSGIAIVWDLDGTLGYYDKKEKMSYLREGIAEALKLLKDKGAINILASSATRRYTDKFLERSGLKGLFYRVYTLRERGVPEEETIKVDAGIKRYEKIRKHLDFNEEAGCRKMIVVGDRPDNDIPWDITVKMKGPVFILLNPLAEETPQSRTTGQEIAEVIFGIAEKGRTEEGIDLSLGFKRTFEKARGWWVSKTFLYENLSFTLGHEEEGVGVPVICDIKRSRQEKRPGGTSGLSHSNKDLGLALIEYLEVAAVGAAVLIFLAANCILFETIALAATIWAIRRWIKILWRYFNSRFNPLTRFKRKAEKILRRFISQNPDVKDWIIDDSRFDQYIAGISRWARSGLLSKEEWGWKIYLRPGKKDILKVFKAILPIIAKEKLPWRMIRGPNAIRILDEDLDQAGKYFIIDIGHSSIGLKGVVQKLEKALKRFEDRPGTNPTPTEKKHNDIITYRFGRLRRDGEIKDPREKGLLDSEGCFLERKLVGGKEYLEENWNSVKNPYRPIWVVDPFEAIDIVRNKYDGEEIPLMESDWTQICIDCVDPVRRGDMYLHGCYFPANMNKEVAKDLVMKTAENGRAIASQQTGEGKVYVWYLPPDLAAETEIIQMAVVVKEGRIHSATPRIGKGVVYVDGRQKLLEQQYVWPGKVENKREDLKIDLMWEEFKRIADLRMSSRVQPENIKGRITILFGENVTLEILDEIIWCIAKNGECIERKKLHRTEKPRRALECNLPKDLADETAIKTALIVIKLGRSNFVKDAYPTRGKGVVVICNGKRLSPDETTEGGLENLSEAQRERIKQWRAQAEMGKRERATDGGTPLYRGARAASTKDSGSIKAAILSIVDSGTEKGFRFKTRGEILAEAESRASPGISRNDLNDELDKLCRGREIFAIGARADELIDWYRQKIIEENLRNPAAPRSFPGTGITAAIKQAA